MDPQTRDLALIAALSLIGSIRRDAIADDANSAAPFAPDKGLPLGIGDKVGATVTNRARADSLAHEVG
jgi:hypothetical protein